jgi:hypothetical protein
MNTTIITNLIQLLSEATEAYKLNPCFRNKARISYLLQEIFYGDLTNNFGEDADKVTDNDKIINEYAKDLYLIIRKINDAGIGLIDNIPYCGRTQMENIDSFYSDNPGEYYNENKFSYSTLLDLIYYFSDLMSLIEEYMSKTSRGRYELIIYRIERIHTNLEEEKIRAFEDKREQMNRGYSSDEYGTYCCDDEDEDDSQSLDSLISEFSELLNYVPIPINVLDFLAYNLLSRMVICPDIAKIQRYLIVLAAKNVIANNLKCSWMFFHAFVISQMYCEDHMILYKLLKYVDLSFPYSSKCTEVERYENGNVCDAYCANGVHLNLSRLNGLEFPVSLKIKVIVNSIFISTLIKAGAIGETNNHNYIRVNPIRIPKEIDNIFFNPLTGEEIILNHNCHLAYEMCANENPVENGFKLSVHPLLPFRYLPIVAFISINCLFGVRKIDETDTKTDGEKKAIKLPFLPGEILFHIFEFL